MNANGRELFFKDDMGKQDVHKKLRKSFIFGVIFLMDPFSLRC